MKTILAQYELKRAELTALEERRAGLEKELRSTAAKLNEAKRASSNSQLDEVGLLRKIWSARKIGNTQDRFQFDNEAPGQFVNNCAPPHPGEGLDSLRAEVDAALRGIYPTAEVEELRTKVEELRRTVKSLEVLADKQLPREIDDLNIQITITKKALLKLDQLVCEKAFYELQAEVKKAAWPLVRRACITANLYNPYFLKWPDVRFFFLLFGDNDLPMSELLSEREKYRAEIFGKK